MGERNSVRKMWLCECAGCGEPLQCGSSHNERGYGTACGTVTTLIIATAAITAQSVAVAVAMAFAVIVTVTMALTMTCDHDL
eukprot:358912-Chlamydomonas_euryale.AAC.2